MIGNISSELYLLDITDAAMPAYSVGGGRGGGHGGIGGGGQGGGGCGGQVGEDRAGRVWRGKWSYSQYLRQH